MYVCMVAYTRYETDNRVRRYAETLVSQGHEVDAIVYRTGLESKKEVLNGVHIYRIQKRNYRESSPIDYLARLLFFFIKSFISISIKHIKHKYDILHVHSIPDFEVFAAIIPKIMGAKIILDIHDIVPEFYIDKFNVKKSSIIFKLLIIMERLSTIFADHVIIANHIWEKRLIDRSVPSNKCTTILNYPDPSIFFPRNRFENSEQFIILYPGTLNKHQGLDIAIEAFSIIKDKIKNAQFHIYGRGPEKEKLLSLIKNKNLVDKIFIKDLKPLHEISKIMSKADLAIVPKRKDSFGNEAFSTKILEFMAIGVPIIAADTAIDRFYFDESNILFFKAGDIEDLVKKILFIYNNNKLKESLINSGFKLIETMNWNVNKYLYFDIIHKLINKPDFVG